MSSGARYSVAVVILISAVSHCLALLLPVALTLVGLLGAFVDSSSDQPESALVGFMLGIFGLILVLVLAVHLAKEFSFWSNRDQLPDEEFLESASRLTTGDIIIGFFLNFVAFICGIVGKFMISSARKEIEQNRQYWQYQQYQQYRQYWESQGSPPQGWDQRTAASPARPYDQPPPLRPRNVQPPQSPKAGIE